MVSRSLPAASWAEMRLLVDLIRRYSLRESSGCIEPRSEANENPLRCVGDDELLLPFPERIESDRFLVEVSCFVHVRSAEDLFVEGTSLLNSARTGRMTFAVA